MSVSDSTLRPMGLRPPWRSLVRAAAERLWGKPEAPASHRTKVRLRWREETGPDPVQVGLLAPPAVLTPSLPTRVSQAPPWVISLTGHLAVVLLLSLWTVAPPAGPNSQVLTLKPMEAVVAPSPESLPALRLEIPDSASEAGRFDGQVIADNLQLDAEVVFDPAVLSAGPTSSLSVDVETLFASGGRGAEGLADSLPGAEFFGVQAVGSRFVFVVDSSNSMREGKLDAAKEELMYSIRRLSNEQFFYVIFFNGHTVPMSLDETGEPAPEPVVATNENIQLLADWVESVHVDPWTDPHEAMQQAIRMQPDAIYLLSDGRFTDRGETIRFLKKENFVREEGRRRLKVVIHTVGFHQRDGEPTLKSIARSYGGTYRFVAPPKSTVAGR